MPRLNKDVEKFLDSINPLYYLERALDNHHDEYYSHIYDVHMNERKIMDDLGYSQEQIVPIDYTFTL